MKKLGLPSMMIGESNELGMPSRWLPIRWVRNNERVRLRCGFGLVAVTTNNVGVGAVRKRPAMTFGTPM
jgi:hypothetical protein